MLGAWRLANLDFIFFGCFMFHALYRAVINLWYSDYVGEQG